MAMSVTTTERGGRVRGQFGRCDDTKIVYAFAAWRIVLSHMRCRIV